MKKHLKTMAKWSKFLGILGLLGGALLALIGFPIFYIGAIPGLLIMILNIRLLRASRSAKRLNYNLRIMKNEQDMYDEALSQFASYFRLQAWIILLITLAIICIGTCMTLVPLDYFTIMKEQFLRVVPFI